MTSQSQSARLIRSWSASVELTHEAVGAVFVAQQVGRSTRMQYVAGNDVGKQFQKQNFDDRLSWHETTVP